MKLLNKTIRSYLIYSFTILLVTIPLFYFVVKTVLLHSVDRSLRTQLRDIRSNLNSIRSQDELDAWSKLDKDISLAPSGENFEDSIYTVYRFTHKHHRNENEPYREIAGIITVGGKMYKLVVSSSLVENEDLLGSILMVQTILLILLMAGLLWINQIISKKIWQPFYTALSNIQQYQLNKKSQLSFRQSDTDEFNELNQAIKNLFSRSHEIYMQQREFTENASHEMQTPLAIFQSKLELLMQTIPLTEEQALLINSLETTNHRLIKLNKSLLLLAKIENNQYSSVDDVHITLLTEKLIEQFQPHTERKEITVTKHYSEDPVVRANNTLIEILIGNLISNAIRYNLEKGKIIIDINKKSFTIKNSGLASPLPPEKIFDRFYKENGSGGDEESIGLGLALVKRICGLYHFDIDYTFKEDLHCFTLFF